MTFIFSSGTVYGNPNGKLVTPKPNQMPYLRHLVLSGEDPTAKTSPGNNSV